MRGWVVKREIMVFCAHLRLPSRRDERTHGWQCPEKHAKVAHLPPHEGLDSETNLTVEQLEEATEEARFITCVSDGLIVGLRIWKHLAASTLQSRVPFSHRLAPRPQ